MPTRVFRAVVTILTQFVSTTLGHNYASVGLVSGLEPAFLAKQLGYCINVFEKTYARWIDRDEDREKLDALML